MPFVADFSFPYDHGLPSLPDGWILDNIMKTFSRYSNYDTIYILEDIIYTANAKRLHSSDTLSAKGNSAKESVENLIKLIKELENKEIKKNENISC